MENMDDMLQKSAIEDQIANFGQTPIQIFRMKHPRRGPPVPIAHPLYFSPQSITLTSSVSSTISHMSAVLFIGLLDNTIILMNAGLILSVKLWLTTQLSGGNFTFSGPQVLPDYRHHLSIEISTCSYLHLLITFILSFCRNISLALVQMSSLPAK